MEGMVNRVYHSLLILICLPDVTDSRIQCLTWKIDHEKLRFICRIPNFSYAVSLFDSKGKLYVKCTFDRYAQHCIPLVRNDSVVANFESNHVIFKTSGLHQDMNGEWICEHNNKTYTTYVSLSKGILRASDVDIAGELIIEKGKSKVKIKCFSCREPDGNNVEFLENNRSVDSLTFRHDTKTCMHQRGECQSIDCSCSRTEFILTFNYETQKNGSIYSCDMLFTDSFSHEKYSKVATLDFNGTEFFVKSTITVIKKAADKIWNGTFTTHTGIEIDTELDPEQTTPVYIPNDTKGGLQTFHVVGIIIGCIALFALPLLFVWQKFQSERGTHGMTEVAVHKESLPQNATTELAEIGENTESIPLLGARYMKDVAVQIDYMPPNGTHDMTEVAVHKESLPQNGTHDMTEVAVHKESLPQNATTELAEIGENTESISLLGTHDMTEVAVHKESLLQNATTELAEIAENTESIPLLGTHDMTEVVVHKESLPQNATTELADITENTEYTPLIETRGMKEVAVHRESLPKNATIELAEIGQNTESTPLIATTELADITENTEYTPLIENFVLNEQESRIVETYLCDPCKNQYKSRSAIFLCIDCEESLCAICSHYHKVMKQTRTHNCVSINKIPRNFSLPLICKDHGTLKYEFYCVDHEFLCCVKCITTLHSGKGCKVEVIDEVSKGFVKKQMFFDYEHQLEKYINLLVNLSTYQYHMIDQMADKKTDCEKLNAYATETCKILLSTREQQELFKFMKDNGSERQLFILTNFLKQSLIETDKRVLKLVENTKRARKHYSDSQDDHGATFPSLEMTEKELMNISLIHRWRQSQTPVLGSRRK